MKLVNFEDFCRMPAGTIFAPYEPCVLLETLSIKTDPGDEWLDGLRRSYSFNGVMSLEPWIDGVEYALWEIGDQEEARFEIYDGSNADYMDYKMFLVFEEADIDRMISVLMWAKSSCVGDPYEGYEEEENCE